MGEGDLRLRLLSGLLRGGGSLVRCIQAMFYASNLHSSPQHPDPISLSRSTAVLGSDVPIAQRLSGRSGRRGPRRGVALFEPGSCEVGGRSHWPPLHPLAPCSMWPGGDGEGDLPASGEDKPPLITAADKRGFFALPCSLLTVNV